MNLNEYLQHVSGKGILSTADAEGKVDAAIYSKPHFFEDGTLAFIMRDHLTHSNIGENPYAAYLFSEHYYDKRYNYPRFLDQTIQCIYCL